VVPRGECRPAAEALAKDIAAFPQTCMRADRASVYAQEGLALDDALRQEFLRGASAAQDREMLDAVQGFVAPERR
jgi:enoyl-CoA hydratase